MHNTVCVTERSAFENLLQKPLHFLWLQLASQFLHVLLKIIFTKLKDQFQFWLAIFIGVHYVTESAVMKYWYALTLSHLGASEI